MVAVAAPAGMPTRQYSAMIIGGAWPHTDPADCQAVSEAQRNKALELLDCAESVRSTASNVAAEQSGSAIDGFDAECHREAVTYTTQADRYFAMSRTSEEVGRLLYGLREDLDKIDADAHHAIQQIMEWVQSGVMNSLQGGVEIMEIVAAARAAAQALASKATAAIAAEGVKSGFGETTGTGGTSAPAASDDPVDPELRKLAEHGGGPGGGPGVRDGFPTGRLDLPEDTPTQPRSPTNDHVPDSPKPGTGTGEGDSAKSGGNPSPGDKASGEAGSAADGLGNDVNKSTTNGHLRDSAEGVSAPALPSSSLGGLGGGGGAPSISPASSSGGMGGGSGFKMPSAPSGLGGGSGLPTQGMGSPGGLGAGGLTGAGGGGAPSMSGGPATSSDFSRGFNAGLGGAPAAFASPVAPPASAAGGSAAPAGVVAAGPPPVAAAGGPAPGTPAVSAASSFTPSAGPGGGGVPSAPLGPLPPFGSDVARSAPSVAPVSPAAGPPAGTPATSGAGSSAGPVAALPPGVVGSGVGASAAAAAEGIRSSLPDPLLASASQLLYQLLHDSRMYPYMDWCVGVFRTSAGIETLIVNSEGAGFIPAGVFVPRSARMLFADGALSMEFRARWFAHANPAETMLAYAELAAEHRSDIELWALAVSTDDGGSSMPARPVIAHVEDCSRSLSPLSPDTPVSQLDDTHAHRLETLDRALYSRLTGFGDGPLPDRSEAWRTTVHAAQMVLGRAGSIPDLAVPAVIREVLELLGQGMPVPAARWQDLEAVHLSAVMAGAGLRPGRVDVDTGASVHALAYHDLTRLIELLLLWNLEHDADRTGIKYAEIAYLAGQVNMTPWMAGVR